MNVIKKARMGNEELRIFQDEDPMNPRTEWDNFGKMVCFHRRYDLGDKHEFSSPEDFDEFLKENEVIILPLYLYDHSGITMRTFPFTSHWDSGQVGYIYATYEQIKKEYDVKRITLQIRKKILAALQSEVDVYDMYIRGDVYGFELVKLTKCDQGEEHEETLDSVGGFFGYKLEENGILDQVDEKWKTANFEDVN